MTSFRRSRLRRSISTAAPALLFVLLLALLPACDGEGAADEATDSPRVVTTLEVFADLARNVGGDRIEVQALLPSGADPHTFELSPGRVADVARADVVFLNGLGLEAGVEDIVRNNAEGTVVELAEGLDVIEGGVDEHEDDAGDHAGGNPHLWLDVSLAQRYVERIRDTLIDADPGGRATYEANAEAYLAELDALDADLRAAIETVPSARRKLVTFHDAFPYLARAYGLEVVAVAVPSPGGEPSAQHIAELTRTLRDQEVPAVFKEPQFDAGILERAASEADVEVLDLLSDAYAEGVQSYIELMRFNMAQLVEGLGG